MNILRNFINGNYPAFFDYNIGSLSGSSENFFLKYFPGGSGLILDVFNVRAKTSYPKLLEDIVFDMDILAFKNTVSGIRLRSNEVLFINNDHVCKKYSNEILEQYGFHRITTLRK